SRRHRRPAPGRAGDQGAHRPHPARPRRAGRDPGTSPAPHRVHAAVHPPQGRRRGRREPGPRHRCRAIPPRCRRALARHRRVAGQAPDANEWRPTGAAVGPRRPIGGGSPMTAILELRKVSKTYGEGAAEVHALVDVDLAVGDGELVAIMGPSGSGKSTLLTMAGTLEEPSGGEVLIGGVATAGMSRNDRARIRRRSVGYVFQDFNLLAGLTAAENVALPLELDGVSAKTAHRAALSAMRQLDIEAKADRFPDELSGGERQRAAIARSIVGDRNLLLADEPTGALDSVNGEAVMRMLRNACQAGIAGVIVNHDAQLASWADRVVFLRDGRIVDQTAPPLEPESLLVPRS